MKSISRFILSPHARIYRRDHDIIVDSPEALFEFTQRSATIMNYIKHEFDGTKPMDAIAEQFSISVRELASTVSVLVEHRVLIDVSPMINATSAMAFLDYYYPICDEWGRDIFTRPFWVDMMTGNAPAKMVLGWGIQFYHRVMGADEHNALAMHYCSDGPLRQLLEHHFKEESDHGEIFLDGLVSVGLDRNVVQASDSLPGTRGLILYLNALATTDILAYLGAYGVMHSPRVGQTAAKINEQFDNWISFYPFAVGILEKIREHALLDVKLGHDEIVLEQTLLDKKTVSPDEALRILAAAYGITQAFNEFFRGIREYYNTIPDSSFPGLSIGESET